MKHWNALMFSAALLLGAGPACADVIVIVSAKSAVGALNRDQVSEIFLGKRSAFPDGGPAVPIDLAPDAASREIFYDKVTGKNAAQLKAFWAKQVFSGKGTPPKEMPEAELKKLIAANPSLIGYIDKDQVDASVKVVFTP